MSEKNNFKRVKDKVSELMDIGAAPCLNTVADLLLVDVAGSFVPGVTGIICNYKIQRMEKNLLRFIDELKLRADKIEDNYKQLSENNRELLKSNLLGIIFDNVIDEQEENKIKNIATGFSNINNSNINNNIILLYDLLKNLKLIEIRVLLEYDLRTDDRKKINNIYYNVSEYLDTLKLSSDSYKYILNRLSQYNLLKADFYKDLEKTIEKMNNSLYEIKQAVMFVQKQIEQNSRRSYVSNYNIRSDSINFNRDYSISNFGEEFIDFFINENSKVGCE